MVPPHLLFYSIEPWDEVWRRNQFVVDLLLRRHPRLTVLFVVPPRNVARRGTRHPTPGGLYGGRLRVVQPARLPLESIGAVRRANERLQAAALRRWLGRDQRPRVLWVNDHHRAHLARGGGFEKVVYDITDDWPAMTRRPRERRLIERHDAELCRRAEATVVCSERLRDLKRPIVPEGRLHLVPNGVHVEHYAGVCDRARPLPEAARGWERPVLGYTGTVHPDRVDVALIEAAARRMDRGTFVFVGPNHLSEGDRRRLGATGRVVLHPAVAYREVPAYMRAFDVLVVPHRCSDFVESLNPIKLWEYLAAGKPIVSTDVAGFRDFPQHVRIARDADELVRAATEALDEDASAVEARRAEARRHSWESRVEQVEAILGWPAAEDGGIEQIEETSA